MLETLHRKRPGSTAKVEPKNISVSVQSVSGGSVKRKIAATNVRPLPHKIILAVTSGQSLRDTQKFEKAVDVLVKVEEAIMRMSRIKSVSWRQTNLVPVDSFVPRLEPLKHQQNQNEWTFSALSIKNDRELA